MNKVGKTTRPFRYDLNQIPYSCAVKVADRFKGLDLTDRMPDELRTEVHDIVQQQGSRPSPRKETQKNKMSVREGLTGAAATSLQSCPTLCDPIDNSPLGSSVPGILQARILEWVAISLSNA